MNDIGQKDVETYIRNLISDKFKSRQGAAKDWRQNKSQETRNCSKPKSENLAAI